MGDYWRNVEAAKKDLTEYYKVTNEMLKKAAEDELEDYGKITNNFDYLTHKKYKSKDPGHTDDDIFFLSNNMYRNHYIRVHGGVSTLPDFNKLKPDELSLDKLEYEILTFTEPVSGGKRKTRRSKRSRSKTRNSKKRT